MSNVSKRVDALWKFATEGDDSLNAVQDTIAALHAVLVTRIFSVLVVCPELRERLPVRVVGEIGGDTAGVFASHGSRRVGAKPPSALRRTPGVEIVPDSKTLRQVIENLCGFTVERLFSALPGPPPSRIDLQPPTASKP